MESRTDLQQIVEKQIEEIIEGCKNEFGNFDSSIIYQALKSSGFVRISAPQEESPVLKMLILDSLDRYHQGNSKKPGNIRLNMKRLVDAIPSVIGAAYNIANDIPVLQVCAALNIWKTFRDAMTVQITKDQAFVIVALWKNCNANNKIELDRGYGATNALLERYGESEMTETKYHKLVDSLVELECIELEENVIWLREWISRRYIDSI